MHPEEKEKWIAETLNSLDGLQRAAAPPGLLEKALRRARPVRVSLPARQSWAMAAGLALLVSVNLWVCFRPGQHRPSANGAENFGRAYFSFVETPNY